MMPVMLCSIARVTGRNMKYKYWQSAGQTILLNICQYLANSVNIYKTIEMLLEPIFPLLF